VFAEQGLQAQQPRNRDGHQTGHYRLAGQHKQSAERQWQQRAGHHGHTSGEHGTEVFVLFASTCNPTHGTGKNVRSDYLFKYNNKYYLKSSTQFSER